MTLAPHIARCLAVGLGAAVSLAAVPASTRGASGEIGAAGTGGASAAGGPVRQCHARSAATAPAVVELYTSEGCSSCPPADRWLSALKREGPVIALAFHVEYWDRLGWKDRFASPAHTQRQTQQQATSGARFNYTPQVLIDGADRPDWPGAAAALIQSRRGPAPVDLQVVRVGDRYTATVSATPMATGAITNSHTGTGAGTGVPATWPRLAAYWAVTEHGHASSVRAGENRGATLTHDFVVREYRPVAAWTPRAGLEAMTLHFVPATPVAANHPRQVNLVIVNAGTGRPVQAVRLSC